MSPRNILILTIGYLLCVIPVRAQNGSADSLTDTLRGSLIELPWSLTEIEEISDIVEGDIFVKEDATEGNFKETAEKFGIIHLATHAVIDDKQPMYSKLVFAKDESDTTEDGYLNTYELYNMKLNAKLAVLSACNTGAGKVVRGEGIMSLARGFTYAGCPSVVMSLWPADDRSTSTIMKSFYEGLARGLPKDEALRSAKLEYINSADPAKASPFYWAGFVPIGDMNPIDLKPKSDNMWYWISGGLLFLLLAGVLTIKFFKRLKTA